MNKGGAAPEKIRGRAAVVRGGRTGKSGYLVTASATLT